MTDLYFLLTDYIIDPASMDAVFPDGALIDMATVERLATELGIDNFSAQTCVGWNAAANLQDSYLDAYYPDDGNGIAQARIHPGFWPEGV